MRGNAIALRIDRRIILAVGLALALVFSLTPSLQASTSAIAPTPVFIDADVLSSTSEAVHIIIQKWNPFDRTSERAVEDMGGTVTKQLPIVNGFSATVPGDATEGLSQLPGAKFISLNRPVHPQGTSTDSNKLKSVYPKVLRATKMWQQGYTGAGVTVALIDTGVTNVPDLNGRVRPIYDHMTGEWSPCVNLTNEDHCDDSYGHGTFMAGIIAGNGAASGGKWKGTAPDADLVSIKIAGRNGAADVSTLLAAIQWTVSFKDAYGIRVLNLSLGTNGTGSYKSDPLNYAVQRAWDAGIVVVVSASNRGPDSQSISKPGDDPWVITVGAIDDQDSVGYGDDTLPDFSSRGPTAADGVAKPDLVAPGGHIVSLRAPGSAIDTEFPNYIDDHYRKGSGTSMSAASVSGAVATILEAHPNMTPNRVKFALKATAKNVASDDEMAVGKGVPDAYAAAFEAPAGEANGGLERSSGLGTLDLTRGDVLVAADDPLLTVVSGALTLRLLLWDPIAYTTSDWTGGSWYGGSWYGGSWYGGSWYGGSWYGGSWYGGSWYGGFDGGSWYGGSWYGGSWYGAWE
jgi:serine protease AprX